MSFIVVYCPTFWEKNVVDKCNIFLCSKEFPLVVVGSGAGEDPLHHLKNWFVSHIPHWLIGKTPQIFIF